MEFNSSRLSFALQKEENRIEEKIIIKKNSKRCFCWIRIKIRKLNLIQNLNNCLKVLKLIFYLY